MAVTERDELATIIKRAHSEWLRNSRLCLQDYIAEAVLQAGYCRQKGGR